MATFHHAFISLGSNIPPKKKFIEKGIMAVGKISQTKLVNVAPLYRTSPLGGPPQSVYLNTVVQVRTLLSPSKLLGELQQVEAKFGRKRSVRWGPRTLDLDLIAFDDLIRTSKRLKLPHPRYHKRKFVLAPFVRLAPIYMHPILQRTNRALLSQLTDSGQRVTILGPWKKQRFYPSKTRKNAKIPSSR